MTDRPPPELAERALLRDGEAGGPGTRHARCGGADEPYGAQRALGLEPGLPRRPQRFLR